MTYDASFYVWNITTMVLLKWLFLGFEGQWTDRGHINLNVRTEMLFSVY